MARKSDNNIVLAIDKNGVKELRLTNREYELYSLIISDPHKCFYSEEIYEAVWEVHNGYKPLGWKNLISVHKCTLNRKLESVGLPKLRTIHGVGIIAR